jgi:DNA-binding transcriptional regulator YiaG
MQIAIQIPTPQVARWLHTSLGKLVAEWEAGEPMPLPILPLMPLLTG